MSKEKCTIGFIGAGGIARAHAFALNSLRYYYNDSPEVEMESVCSFSEKSRKEFSEKYGFKNAVPFEEFIDNKDIDTVFILGPNSTHYDNLTAAIQMPSVKRIYIEKPLCSTYEEEIQMTGISKEYPDVKIHTGFQFLFMPSVREAIKLWKSGIFGLPIHFDLKYYHGDYLQKEYRDKRITRLTPSPDGGAMADLGSHAISLATAFMGDKLQIAGAIQAGRFNDVITDSDLFSLVTLTDPVTKAAGTLSASRISSGSGDLLSMEIYCDRGMIKLSSQSAEYFEYYLEDTGCWYKISSGSNYKPLTSFPSGHVPPGWLRSMIHAHYVFITGTGYETIIPDIGHALAVQRLVRESSDHLKTYRELTR